MNHFLHYAMFCSFLLVSLAGVCMATESSMDLGYIQGGSSTVTNGSDGNMVITIQDMIPYFNLADGDKSHLTPIDQLTKLTYPVNAAMVFSGAGNESVSMVTISNLSLSDENNALTLQVTPMKYYDGTRLKTFADMQTELSIPEKGAIKTTQMYIETEVSLSENAL